MNPKRKKNGRLSIDATATAGVIPVQPKLPVRKGNRWIVFGICILLAVITLAVFGQTWHFAFVNFDDSTYIYENNAVTGGLTLKGIAAAFSYKHFDNWIPLTAFSHILDWEMYGDKAGGHHLTNVLLHTASVILLFLVLRRMTGALWQAAFVAAVFAIHPLRAESVAWVSERKDVMSGLFFMLALWAYQKNAECRMQNAESKKWKWVVLLFFAMGLMSKPMLVTLPFVLLLLDYWPLQRTVEWKNLIVEKLPLFALALTSCVITVFAQKHGHALPSLGDFSIPSRISNALDSCVVYIRQMFNPTGLVVYYPRPENGFPLWEPISAFLMLAGISLGAFIWRRKSPYLLVGWLWYLGMLAPVIGLIQVGEQTHADRYTYLPQIGLYIMMAWGAAELTVGWRYRHAVLGGAAAMAIVALIFCARLQVSYWKDSEALWTRALACTSNNVLAENNLGTAYLQNGRLNEAMAQFQKALKIQPNYAYAHYNLGTDLLQKGQVDEAMAEFQKTVEIQPDYAQAHYNLGVDLLQKGRLNEAIAQFQKAVKSQPDYAYAHNNLGNALLQEKQVDEAITQFQNAVEIQPKYILAHDNLGKALLQQGRLDEAAAQFSEALRLNSNDTEARQQLDTLKR